MSDAVPQRLIDYAGASPTALAAQITWWTPSDAAQFVGAAIGLLLAFCALPRVLSAVLTWLRALAPVDRRWILAALALALVLRLLVPARLVMLFSGYELVDRSAVLTSVHRYGAGSQVLHRALFAFLPPDHATLQTFHRLVSWLALWPLLAWFSRCQPPLLAQRVAAFGLATLPLLVRDAATESILIPGALWLWSGLLLLETQRPGDAWRAVVLLAAAGMTRPELAIVAPLLAVLTLRRHGVRWQRGHYLLAALYLALIAPQLWHSVERLSLDAAQGTNRLGKILPLGPLTILSSWLPLWPLAFPLAWTVLALLGLRQRDPWRRDLLVATYFWAILLLVDLPLTSVPRLQAPLASLWLLLGAWHYAEIARPRPRLALLAVVVTTLPTFWLFAPTNEDDSERFTRAALEHLPPRDACLVTLHESDPPDKGKVQRAFADYLLRPPHRSVQRFGMREWQAAGALHCPAGTFLLIEHRCYAIFQHPASAPNVLPICSETLAQHPWQPVLQERATNHGQNEYGWYPDVPAFDLGLFRL